MLQLTRYTFLRLQRDERECIAILLGKVLLEEDDSAEHSGKHWEQASFSDIFKIAGGKRTLTPCARDGRPDGTPDLRRQPRVLLLECANVARIDLVEHEIVELIPHAVLYACKSNRQVSRGTRLGRIQLGRMCSP